MFASLHLPIAGVIIGFLSRDVLNLSFPVAACILLFYVVSMFRLRPLLPWLIAAVLTVATVSYTYAQSPEPVRPSSVSNLYMIGGAYNPGAVPAFAGSAMYAHKLNDSGTYAFSMLDALPNTGKPFTVTTNVALGVAQRVVTIDKVDIFMPTAAGISYTGTNTGWAWSTGAGAAFNVRPNWYVMPTVRVLKSSVSQGTGYQPIVGVLFGWGQ